MESINNKRRREMLTAAAAINFTSTPIRKRKENLPDFLDKEIKGDSAEELAKFTNVTLGDTEVMRPPMKKMKRYHIEENIVSTCCYSNPALDLKAKDRILNPFEVMRTDVINSNKGFSNPALEFDIEKEDERTEGRMFNPHVSLFEVFRKDKESSDAKGIDNYALELNSPEHKPLLLALPFQPTVNHRIDFSNYPNLMPLKYQQQQEEDVIKDIHVSDTQKLPEETSAEHLSIITEEESEVDIGQELDNYQLELENSINEAKIKKMCGIGSAESNDNKLNESGKKSPFQLEETGCNDLKESRDDDVQFEEVDSFEDYGNFKRAYRKENVNQVDEATKKSSSNFPFEKKRFTTIMRNSVRKLIKSKSSRQTQTKESHETKENNHNLGLIQTIRQSLRRKNRNQKSAVYCPNQTISENRKVFKEISTVLTKSASTIQTATDQLVTVTKLDIKTKKTFQENVEIFNNL